MSTQENDQTEEPQPPTTHIIEASCSGADNRTSDNATWTNIIRQPITVNKGSEIKIQTNYIDLRGIDSDIIELQLNGSTQDNAHTLLTQMYTTNDGINNKTCSYDYIASRDTPFVIDPGEGYAGGNFEANSSNTTTDGNGSGIAVGKGYTVERYAYGLRKRNTKIVSPGIGYTNGSKFRLDSPTAAPGDWSGKIFTDSKGRVVDVVFSSPTSNSNFTVNSETEATFVFERVGDGGEGLKFFAQSSAGALRVTGVNGNHQDAGKGENYRPGDKIFITKDSTGSDIDVSNQYVHLMSQTYIGPGALLYNQSMFDPGYNYEKTPVERWDQCYDMTTNFSYGKNTGLRTITSHGVETIIDTNNSHQIDEPCLSAGKLLTAREDPFAPGVFHDDPKNRTFRINSPVVYFSSAGVYPFTLQANTITGGWTLRVPTPTTTTINNNTVDASPLNSMPIGSVYTIQFDIDYNSGIVSDNRLVAISELQKRFSTPMRVRNVRLENNRTVVDFSASLIEYVGSASLFNVQDLSPPATYPLNIGSLVVDMVYQGSEDNGQPPTVLPKALVVYTLDGSATSVSVANGGKGCRVGQYFSLNYPGSTEKIYITQIDSTGGWDFPSDRSYVLDNSKLSITYDGETYKYDMYLIPVQNFSDLSSDMTQKGNSIMFREESAAPEIDIYPPTLSNGFLRTSSSVIDDSTTSSRVVNGLYRPSGSTDTQSPFYESRLGALTRHDQEATLTITDSQTDFKTISSASFGASGLIVPFGTSPDLWTRNGSTNQLRIDLTQWSNAGLTLSDLPTNTYIVITNTGSEVPTHECHIQTGGLDSVDATYYLINVICPDIHSGRSTTTNRILSTASSTYMGISEIPANGSSENNLNEWGLTNLKLLWVNDPKRHNTQIVCKTDNMKGSIAFTGLPNFFGNNDTNRSIMINQPLYKNASDSIINSYNKGGYYFLTHVDSTLNGKTVPATNVFNNGYTYWNMAEIPSTMMKWRTDYKAPGVYNYNQSFCDIGKLWDYFKLYRQKTFVIDKPFVVASDISGLWTREAHKLGPSQDPYDGTTYVESDRSGILQNEFIMPVYGSNNEIGPDGLYILLDGDDEPFELTGGLEPGHCVGKNYISSDNLWLNGALLEQMPRDTVGDTFYYVFFRTAFTNIRGYDPLASVGTTGLPDRTPLETVNQKAFLIGNSNAVGSTTQKYLDGTPTLQTTATTVPPSDLNDPDTRAYELGPGLGVSQADQATNPTRFGESSDYPIYYLDTTQADKYPNAKISQYVGTQSIELAFATDISTFTFQYLHSPFTSPYVDGQGGVDSVRVFFGNRRDGIRNHDTLGGVVVVNYCRPDFPRSTFTNAEISKNIVSNNFPNGIDPLRSVGRVGRAFMNKIGFTDSDIGVENGLIALDNKQLNWSTVSYTRNITLLTDGDVGTNTYNITSRDVNWYGTTGSDLDTSDSILSQIPAPEENPGLESHNVQVVPEIGKSVVILRKFGDYIFYPYSINRDNNSFNTTSNTRFDNASSTYGAVGGLKLSNSNRGLGIPNTLGSTFITDDNSLPRTLNPDCELYLAYTVAVESSQKKASLLPVKLNNGYLMILSSLLREPSLYMANNGFVNCMSIVNFTFLQGDYVLSQGEMTFYCKETFVLSEITTQIKDKNFLVPSSLGINSSVIYSIIDYNPKPQRQFETIEQIQDKDIEIMKAVQHHQDYLNGRRATSRMSELHSDLYSLGIDLIQHKNEVDVISAIRNQIESHDLKNLSPAERTQFLRSPEGEILLQNVGDMQVIQQQTSDMAERENDINGEYGGLFNERENLAQSRVATKEIAAREQAIRERTPLLYFQPSDPVDEQIPPVSGIKNINIREVNNSNFRLSIPYRYSNYLDYREDTVQRLKNPKSFLEYQQFQYGNVLQPKTRMKDTDKDFLADVERFEGEGGQRFYEAAIREMDPDSLTEARKNPFLNAYKTEPRYDRGAIENDELQAFMNEVRSGTADLSHIQRQILGDKARPVHAEIGKSRPRNIDREPQFFSKRYRKEIGQKVFLSKEELDAADNRLDDFRNQEKAIISRKGRPTREEQKRLDAVREQKIDYVSSLRNPGIVNVSREPLSVERIYRPKTEAARIQLQNYKNIYEKSDTQRDNKQRKRERKNEMVGNRSARAGPMRDTTAQSAEMIRNRLREMRERSIQETAVSQK